MSMEKDWKDKYISYFVEKGEHMKIRIHTENVFKHDQ